MFHYGINMVFTKEQTETCLLKITLVQIHQQVVMFFKRYIKVAIVLHMIKTGQLKVL